MDTKNRAEGAEEEGREANRDVPTIGVGEKIFNYGAKAKNIEGSSPRTKNPLRAAATKADEVAGFIPQEAQRAGKYPSPNSNETNSRNPSLGTEVKFLDLEPPSNQGREYFPSPLENMNVGQLKSNTQDKAYSPTVPGIKRGKHNKTEEVQE